MVNENTLPNTLLEAVEYFKNADNCLTYLSSRRWPDGVVTCPRCGSKDVGFIASRRVWQCKTRHPLSQFSIKVGTIFEDSPLGLDKWLPALWMIGNDRNGISSWELHRALGGVPAQNRDRFGLLAMSPQIRSGSGCREKNTRR